MLSLILLIAAFLCAFAAAIYVPNPPPARPVLGWLALCLYFLSVILRDGATLLSGH